MTKKNTYRDEGTEKKNAKRSKDVDLRELEDPRFYGKIEAHMRKFQIELGKKLSRSNKEGARILIKD